MCNTYLTIYTFFIIFTSHFVTNVLFPEKTFTTLKGATLMHH